jgi:hypothetical protein
MKKRIYLAGQMGGLTIEDATYWRDYVRGALHYRSDGRIECYSPTRGHLGTTVDGAIRSDADNSNPLTTARGIMVRDYEDCRKADLIFVNFNDCTRLSIGTIMEMGFAYAHRIPVIAVITPGNMHGGHPMMEEAFTCTVPSLDEGIDATLSFLLPE